MASTSHKDLTHFNAKGDVHMVDIGDKNSTKRTAIARGQINMHSATLAKIAAGDHKKGDVLTIARVAAIMAAKKTADTLPLCHPISLTKVNCDFEIDADNNQVNCTVVAETTERTGIEMEALVAVNAGLLTIYDMCKAVDRGMEINQVHLVHKSGGNSGTWQREA